MRRPVGLDGDDVLFIRKLEDIPALLRDRSIPAPRRWMLETGIASYNEIRRQAALFPEAVVGDGSRILQSVRAIKTPYEIERLRESGARHADVYREIPSIYRAGMSDVEFSIEIERLSRLHGSLGQFRIAGQSMEIFMGSLLTGDNADQPSPYDFAMGGAGLDPSLPVGCNGTLIRPGNTVMVDMGGNFTGYMTDMSRVFSLGEIPLEAIRAHRLSLEIQQAVVETARPGVEAAALYRLAQEMARKAGLESHFMGHRNQAGVVGHGVGIEINEQPVLAPRSKEILQAGMTFALEPKFVIPHVGPVGIENTFVVTESGIEQITCCEEEIVSLS